MKDWIGLWFEIQAERGHSDAAPFFLAWPREKKFENFSFRHRDQDGVAAMSGALAQLGLHPGPREPRPMLKPPYWAVPRLLWRGLAGNSQGSRPNWRVFRPEKKEKPRRLAFIFLDEKKNSALADFLKSNRISLTSYLLAKLPLAMGPELFAGQVSGSWLLPVDMRPAFPERPLSGNCVSYIKTAAATDAEAIHQQIKRALGTFEHWSNWWIYHIGKFVGYRGMQKLSLRSSRRTFWLGSFTDLGDWTPAASAAGEAYRESVWAIVAPGTPNNPVGCATVAWFGKRSISLRVHTAICENSEQAARLILGRLAKIIAQDSGGQEAELLETEIQDA